MEIRHTPGPWEFRTYANGCTIVSTHDAPGQSVRDRLKGIDVHVHAVIRDDQSNAYEASPDAHLIAAAPELLAALQAITNAADDYCIATGHKEPGAAMFGCCDSICEAVAAARAAIAKATGAQQ